MDRQRAGLILVLAGGATLVAICWALLLLQGTGPSPASGAPTARPRAAAPAPAPALDLDLPAPGERPPRGRKNDNPDRIEAEAPRLGPKAIIGRVFEEATDEPIGAFQVYVVPHAEGSPIDRLDQAVPTPFHRKSGIFRIDRKAGLWDVVVRAPGFEATEQSAIEVPAENGRALPFPMRRGAGIVGRAFDGAGRPAAGVKVFLHVVRLNDAGAAPPRITVATTALDGGFHFSPLPAGDYAVSLLEPTNTTDRMGGIRVWDATTTITVYMQPRHQVQLKVNNERGRPVASAAVELQSDGHYAAGKSNDNGVVLLDHLPDGEFTVRVSRRGYQDFTDRIDLAGGSSHQVHWVTLLGEDR